MTDLQHQLIDRFPSYPWRFDCPLAPFTYFKIGGPAQALVELRLRQQIIDLAKFCRLNQIKLTLLGGASNVVIADEGISGVTLSLASDRVGLVDTPDEDQVSDHHRQQLTPTPSSSVFKTLRAEAGARTALVVRKSLDLGLTGLEYFLGVPGKLGGAVVNNAHYLQDLLDRHIHQVEMVNDQAKVVWLDHDSCQFGYDTSRFKNSAEIILTVDFKLKLGSSEQSSQLVKEATQYRAQTQPLGLPSSGCIFQNVPNTPDLKKRFPQLAHQQFVSGGFLIDQAGLKGQKQGDIVVSDKHAAFFVNLGQGRASDVKKLVERIIASVKAQFGIELQAEVFFLS